MFFNALTISFLIPWEMLKTSGFALGFQHLFRDLTKVQYIANNADPYINVQNTEYKKIQAI